MKHTLTILAIILTVITTTIVLGGFWWWALLGMSDKIGLALFVTCFVTGFGALGLATEAGNHRT